MDLVWPTVCLPLLEMLYHVTYVPRLLGNIFKISLFLASILKRKNYLFDT